MSELTKAELNAIKGRAEVCDFSDRGEDRSDLLCHVDSLSARLAAAERERDALRKGLAHLLIIWESDQHDSEQRARYSFPEANCERVSVLGEVIRLVEELLSTPPTPQGQEPTDAD